MVDEFMGEIGGEVYIYTRGIPAPCLGGPDTLPHHPPVPEVSPADQTYHIGQGRESRAGTILIPGND